MAMQKTSRRNTSIGLMILALLSILTLASPAVCWDCGGKCQFQIDCPLGCDCIKKGSSYEGVCF